MKTLVAALIGLAVAMTAYPAAAYVVAVTTSIPAQSVADDDDLDAALKSAIDDVFQHVVAFSPTFVTVKSARAVGGRVYILLLIGDDDGAATLKALSEGGPDDDLLTRSGHCRLSDATRGRSPDEAQREGLGRLR